MGGADYSFASSSSSSSLASKAASISSSSGCVRGFGKGEYPDGMSESVGWLSRLVGSCGGEKESEEEKSGRMNGRRRKRRLRVIEGRTAFQMRVNVIN